MKCIICGGPAHPATGAQYTATAIACGPCVRDFWGWVRRHTSRRWGGLYFYDHVHSPSRLSKYGEAEHRAALLRAADRAEKALREGLDP